MRIFTSPRPGRCASCEGHITGRPVYRMDESYCCVGCVVGGPCVCDYEADLADDGVDGLGLPFALEGAAFDAVPAPDAVPAREGPVAAGSGGRAVEAELATEPAR